MMNQGFVVPIDVCTVCGGSGHMMMLASGGSGVPVPGTIHQGLAPGSVFAALRVSHCEACKGSGKDPKKAKVSFDPNAPLQPGQ